MTPPSNVPTAKLRLPALPPPEEFSLRVSTSFPLPPKEPAYATALSPSSVASSRAAATSSVNSELPEKNRTASDGAGDGTALAVGPLDALGPVVVVGELLGRADGTAEGFSDGALDIEGDIDGMELGIPLGSNDVVGA